ncbi:MAG: hypothetical protein JJD97_15985, partial [Gemmatimonadaceae bacterium]|nr:hypothetical protein [Gemmatimonadaceae bacterium]
MIVAHATRARDVAQRLALIVALGGVAWGCPRGGTNDRGGDLYAHGRIHVSKKTAARWDANERDIAEVGEGIKSIPADDRNPQMIPFKGDARATLEALKPSERHGATDKRMLSLLGPKKTVVSSGIVAQITMVKG